MAFDLIEDKSPAHEPQPVVRRWPAVVAYVVLFLAIPLGFAQGGTTSTFSNAGLTYMPFLVLAVLAYLGVWHTQAKILSILWLLLMFIVGALVAVGLSLAASGGQLFGANGTAADGLDPVVRATVGQIALGVLVALGLGCLCFIPFVRRGLGVLLPIDPGSFVHTIALVTVVAFTVLSTVPLFVLGEPPMLASAILDNMPAEAFDETQGLLGTVYALIWSIPVAILAVGYGIRRDLRATLQRLGFVRPTLLHIGVGILVGVVLVFILMFVEGYMTQFWQNRGWPETDEEAFSKLIAFAFTPLGAVAVAISAGVGEELAVRGVLQPRLGILLSNLFFTSLHAFQYNWDALLVVFLVGASLGVLRQYTNTSTSAIAHGVYDFVLIMLAIYEIQLF